MAETVFRLKMSRWLQQTLLILALTRNFTASQELKGPAIVQPLGYHERTKREILSTRDITSGTHHSEIQVMVPVFGEQWLLDLQLNEELVAGEHTLQYQEGGKTVQLRPGKEELDLCHYTGSVRGKPGSWVAVSTCNGIRGVIFDGQTMRYIEPTHSSELNAPHYLYNHKDLNTNYSFGHEGSIINDTSDPKHFANYQDQKYTGKRGVIRNKRKIEEQIRGPYNVNKKSRYVELVLVVDHKEFQANGGSLRTVHSKMVQLANAVNSLLSQLNIYIALVGVVVWNERNEIRLDRNSDITLSNFLSYRKKKLNFDIPNDNAYLITNQKFDDGLLGKSLTGPICSSQFSGSVAMNHSTVLGVLAATVAHGIGHNLGMKHDSENCFCPDEECIMSSTISSVVPLHWSSCSLSSLALAFERGMDFCLRNKPKRLFNSPTCGNGFIELGEQCDCGTALGGVTNQCHVCCNPDTCMLRENATCAAGSCCDLTTCSLKSAGIVCRTADRECDLPEFCTGHSEFCPSDVFLMDSTPCGFGDNQAYCVRGVCRSHTDQCQLLWSTTGESSDRKCYNHNTKGIRNGNCGYNQTNQTYKPCFSNDVLCGLLHCRHLNERLEFGMESTSFLSAMFINNNGSIIPCRTASIDLGWNDGDPGLVPDGAKCGHERMCINQKCVSIESVREAIRNGETSVCPSDCSGQGICNSEGHCHCNQGFAPPLCNEPGPGGSVDSGPATDLVSLLNRQKLSRMKYLSRSRV